LECDEDGAPLEFSRCKDNDGGGVRKKARVAEQEVEEEESEEEEEEEGEEGVVWTAYEDDDGDKYYYNSQADKSTYKRPDTFDCCRLICCRQMQVSVLDPSGTNVCEIITCSASSIREVKVKVEAKGGLTGATLSLYLARAEQPLRDWETLKSCGLPAELYAFVLQKVGIAKDIARVPRECLNDNTLKKQFTIQSRADACKGADIIDLQACYMLKDVGCLSGLAQMQELNISGCESLDAESICTVITKSVGLSKLVFGSLKVRPFGNLQRIQAAAITIDSSMTSLPDLSAKHLTCLDEKVLVAFLPKCRVLSKLVMRGTCRIYSGCVMWRSDADGLSAGEEEEEEGGGRRRGRGRRRKRRRRGSPWRVYGELIWLALQPWRNWI
jgi:hypothetical protein